MIALPWIIRVSAARTPSRINDGRHTAFFHSGAAFRETDEGIDYHTLINDLLTGQYDQVLRVVAFNPAEGWSRDASEDVASELERRIGVEDREISDALKHFIESQLGRRIGVQLPLPLPLR
jgi:hypothetical protein